MAERGKEIKKFILTRDKGVQPDYTRMEAFRKAGVSSLEDDLLPTPGAGKYFFRSPIRPAIDAIEKKRKK